MDARHDATRTDPEQATGRVSASAGPVNADKPPPRKDRIAARLLIPLVVAVLGLSAYNIYCTRRMATEQLRRTIADGVKNAHRLMDQMIADDALRLQSALDTFAHDEEFKRFFRARDRDALLEHAFPLFRDLSERHGVTRFYFIEPDGTAFARLHRPTDYGQKVTHTTLQKAIETQQPASGIELGKTAVALRVVQPYYNGDELLGYIEFAEDTDHILRTIASEGTCHIIVVTNKQFLDRAGWEATTEDEPSGLRTWDAFDDVVVSSATLDALSPRVRSLISCGRDQPGPSSLVRVGPMTYGIGRLPMTDVLGREVGSALILYNVTDRIAALTRTVWAQALAGAAIACVVILLSYGILRRMTRALIASRAELDSHSARLGRALDREQRVRNILTAVLGEPALDKVLKLLADSAREMTGAELGAIVLLDHDTGALANITPSNYPLDAVPPDTIVEGRGALRALVNADGPVRLDDVTAHPAFTGYPDWHPKVRALLGAPLRDDTGTLGLFALGHTDPARRFSDSDETLFATISGLATVAIRRALTIENIQDAARGALEASDEARLARETAERQATETAAAYDELFALKQKLAMQNAILEAANRTVDLQETLRGILDSCLEQFTIDSGGIYLIDLISGDLVLRHSQGLSPEFAKHVARYERGAPDVVGAFQPEALFFDDYDATFKSDAARAAEDVRSVASVPLLAAGTLIGRLNLASHTRTAIGADVRETLVEAGRLVGPAIANALQAEELERFNRVAAGREDRIIEMKREVNQLLIETGQEPKYTVTHHQLSPTQ